MARASAIWPANDALCTALQVINHLQDCAKDYRALDRVYIPLDALAAQGTGVESLAAAQASPALRKAIAGLARRTGTLLEQSRPFAGEIADRRLALEVGVIQTLAESLVIRLTRRDPLSERVHHHAGRGDRPGAARRSRRRHRLARPNGPPQATPAGRQAGMTIEPQAEADPAALQAQVSGSSFYAAMRVMPKAEREAMFAIYSYCRMVDDIADDGTRPRATRATELDRWREDLERSLCRQAGRSRRLPEGRGA